ncbi:MAG: sugar ABC transporter substrate-binding protein [Treponema sp.]|jgi:inositol transport system substrate-binding protein|nr:sugar ABC transporter substrate-binding protein [Treponema sp.]
MKKIFGTAFVLTVVCSSLFFAGCEGRESGKKRALYIARTQGDAFAAWLANAMTEEAEKYPAIALTVQDGQSNDAQIASYIENGIANRYDVIVVQPQNTEAQRPPAEKVVAANIPLVTVNLRIPGMETVSHSVDASPYEQGAVNARAALSQIPQDARVVVLNGPAAHPHSNERRRAWKQEFFDKRPDVQIVGEQYANWNKDEAMRYMEDWVQANDRIDAVCSMNDNMATGAIEVIKNNPKFRNLLVYGVDGTAEAALLIQEGKMTSTSFQNAYLLAETSMRIVNDILTGQAQGFLNVDIECPLITKDNVASLIETHKRAGAIQ